MKNFGPFFENLLKHFSQEIFRNVGYCNYFINLFFHTSNISHKIIIIIIFFQIIILKFIISIRFQNYKFSSQFSTTDQRNIPINVDMYYFWILSMRSIRLKGLVNFSHKGQMTGGRLFFICLWTVIPCSVIEQISVKTFKIHYGFTYNFH